MAARTAGRRARTALLVATVVPIVVGTAPSYAEEAPVLDHTHAHPDDEPLRAAHHERSLFAYESHDWNPGGGGGGGYNGGGGGSSWDNDPNSESSVYLEYALQEQLELWLRADDGVQVGAEGAVEEWRDVKPGGTPHHFAALRSGLKRQALLKLRQNVEKQAAVAASRGEEEGSFKPAMLLQQRLSGDAKFINDPVNAEHSSVQFPCGLVSRGFQLRDRMTIFLVMKPQWLEHGDQAVGQRFMGHYPFGQLRFHDSKVGLKTRSGEYLLETTIPNADEWLIVAYRLDGDLSAAINGAPWAQMETPRQVHQPVEFSDSGFVTLGGSNADCGFVGHIAEVLVFKDVLEDGAARRVAEYLGARHDVELAAAAMAAPGAGARLSRPEAILAQLPPDVLAARQAHIDKRHVAAGMPLSGELPGDLPPAANYPDADGVVASGTFQAGFPGGYDPGVGGLGGAGAAAAAQAQARASSQVDPGVGGLRETPVAPGDGPNEPSAPRRPHMGVVDNYNPRAMHAGADGDFQAHSTHSTAQKLPDGSMGSGFTPPGGAAFAVGDGNAAVAMAPPSIPNPPGQQAVAAARKERASASATSASLRGTAKRTAEGGDGLDYGDASLSKRQRAEAEAAKRAERVGGPGAVAVGTDIAASTPAELALKKQMEDLQSQLSLLMGQKGGEAGGPAAGGSAASSRGRGRANAQPGQLVATGGKCLGGDAFERVNHQGWQVPETAPLEAIQQWRDAYTKMTYDIKKFELGGKPLRDFIHTEVNKIKLLRHKLFCAYA